MAHVVLIEDDRTLLRMVEEELRDLGHEVRTAADGEAGLALVEQSPPDAVVCDITMPKINGYRLKEMIDERGLGAGRMTFIFMSGHDSQMEIADGLMLGADHYFTKPVDFERLAAVLGGLRTAA